ncbi:MAG: hypothetical protein WD273_02255 [Trueperaceae bacterium]
MKNCFLLFSLVALTVALAACTPGAVQPDTITYGLDPLEASGVSGTVTFEKISDTETVVTIDVDGLQAGQMYPAHIHEGDHPDGAIYISLEMVDGATGMSVTTVTETDAGASVDYDYLVNYDGYVNVHEVGGTPVLATGETGAGGNDVQIEPAGF